MNTIIDFNNICLPVGTVAFHSKYRSCKIIEAIGQKRKIRYCQYENDKMIFKCAVVLMRDLQVSRI